uniref:Unconventional myosin-Va n=1 Tax=Elaeophora elaphi TaxID=1147741 RepID=A0A0R3S5Z2_9BILA
MNDLPTQNFALDFLQMFTVILIKSIPKRVFQQKFLKSIHVGCYLIKYKKYFRLRKIEEDEGNDSVNELGATPLNPSILQELDEEQQAHIKEVFRRAEQSQKEARVVLNTEKLSRLSDARFRGTIDENEEFFTVRNESFVQMDSLPESTTIEVTEAYDSLFSSNYSCSESLMGEPKDKKDSSNEQPGNFTQNIKRLSKQLHRWMSSLDDGGGDVLTSARKLVRFSTPVSIEKNTSFAKYVSKMSHEICTLAVADSVCKIVLDQYCQWLCTVIFTAVYNELKLKYGTNVEIDRYCSELTMNIFKCVYMNAVELLCDQEQLNRTWSGNDHNVHIASLRASSTTFKKSVSCECIQSLAHLIDQELTLYHQSEIDDDGTEEFRYVLLEEDKEKLSRELTSVLQNFAEELWIHILALVLADVILKKQDFVLKEQFPRVNLTSSVQENIQEERQNSFSSIDDYINLDDSSCSVSSGEFVNEYTLLDNEKQSLHLYMKQQIHGKISPPLILYEVDPTRDIYLTPSLTGTYETKKQSRSGSRGSSDSEFSETEWNTRQQFDSESNHSESFYEEKSISTAMEQLNIDEDTGNTEVMKYIEKIIKEAECVVSDESTSKTTQNGKIFGQERNMDNLEIDLTTSLEEWSSSTLSAMIRHATSTSDSEVKLENHEETDMVCLDSRIPSETLESKNSIHNLKMKENGRNALLGEEQTLPSLSDLTTEIPNNFNESEEENNMQDITNQIHESCSKKMPLESCFLPTEEGKPLNISQLMPEMEFPNSITSDVLDEKYSDFNMVMTREKNEVKQSFTVERRKLNELASEEIHKKFQIKGMNLKEIDKDEIKSDELTTTEIQELEDQKKHYPRQIDLKNKGEAVEVLHLINKTNQEDIKYKDLKVGIEGWEIEGDEAYQNAAEEASLLDDYETVLHEKLENDIEEREVNRSINTGNKSTFKTREENEADGLLFELNLDSDQQNLDIEIQQFDNKAQSTYHATSAVNVALISKDKPMISSSSCNADDIQTEILSPGEFKELKTIEELHQLVKKRSLPQVQQYPVETFPLDSKIDQQKIDCLHTVVSNASRSHMCAYKTNATNNASSSTFQLGTISPVDSLYSKGISILDSLRNDQIKENVCQNFKTSTTENAAGNAPDLLTFGTKQTASDAWGRLNESAQNCSDAMIPGKQLLTNEGVEKITNVASIAEKE